MTDLDLLISSWEYVLKTLDSEPQGFHHKLIQETITALEELKKLKGQ